MNTPPVVREVTRWAVITLLAVAAVAVTTDGPHPAAVRACTPVAAARAPSVAAVNINAADLRFRSGTGRTCR